MPCGPDCACLGTDVECLSVVDPARFGHFREWCQSGDPLRRSHVLNRSRIGLNPPPAPAPGLMQKAANLGKAIVDHVAAGMPAASDPVVRTRLEICGGCDRFDAEHRACRSCGCQVDIKVRWLEQRCPIGKW